MRRVFSLLVIAVLLLSGCVVPDDPTIFSSGKSAWVILVYLDSDNNLEPAAILDIDKMEQVGSGNSVKIIVQWDRIPGFDSSNDDWTGTKRFLIAKDGQQGIIASKEIMDLGEVDMASADSLADFIEWGMQNYPAEKYALVLWNHGGGWNVHTQDETNGTQANLQTLKDAFAKAGFAEKKLDLLVFDQCLMSQIDVAYAVAPFVKTMVASEDVIPFSSINYASFLKTLEENPGADEKQFSKEIVESYKEFYTTEKPNPFTTLTAIDLEKMPAVNAAATEFVGSLKKNLEQKWPEIGESLLFSESFATPEGIAVIKSFSTYDLLDFADLARQKTGSPEIEQSASSLKTAVESAIIAEYHGKEHPYAKGITVYFPEDEILYNPDYPDGSSFATESGWDELVKQYISLEKTDTIAPSLAMQTVSSKTTSIRNPITINGTATGNNIVSLFRVLGYLQGNKIFLIDSHPLTQVYQDYEGDRKLPEFLDGANNIDYTMTPIASEITNGEKTVVAPLQPFGKGDYYFTVQGEYRRNGEQDTFNAMLVFDYRYGSLLGALEIAEENEKATQKEFLLQQGDVFTPYVEFYDQSTQIYGMEKLDSLAIGKQGLSIDVFLLPEGDYMIGLFVSDITGNTATDFATVKVTGQPEQNNAVSKNSVIGKWIGDGLGFEILEGNKCISTVGLKQTECEYRFRNNNGLPLISFYIKKEDVIFVNFMAEASENKLSLTEMLEGKKYVLWREGTTPEPSEIDEKIIGKWENSLGNIEFNENSGFSWEINNKIIAGDFSTSNGKLSLTSNGKTTDYSYAVSGDSLSLTDPDGAKLEFTKAGTTIPVAPTANSILGSWYNAGVDETVTFNADGSYDSYISGNFFTRGTYSVSGNTLATNSILGFWIFTFEIKGNLLILFDNLYGSTTVYVRK